MMRFPFTVEIKQRAPFLQHGLAQASIGHDATPLLDQQGRVILSGDQIEGYVAALMHDDKLKARWFGWPGPQVAQGVPPNERDEFESPRRSRVKIYDLVADKAPDQWIAMTRNRVDDETGAVEPGALQVIAQTHLPGDTVCFAGKGWVLAENEGDAETFIAWLRAALELVPALGAIKSGGYGEIVDKKVEGPFAGCRLAPSVTTGPTFEAVTLELTFDQPFLVDPDVSSGNVYDSAEIIPGNILKGAIADMLTLAGVKSDYDTMLEVMTVRHAFPGKGRPKITPLSLAAVGEVLVDALSSGWEGVPRFQMDWKADDWDRAQKQDWYRPGLLPNYVRTRTAVGSDNIAKDTNLFSQRMIATHDGDRSLKWQSALVLPKDVDERTQEQLGALARFLESYGILRIGKTAAPVTVQLETYQDEPVSLEDRARIILQTPAWMTPDSDLLDNEGNPKQARAADFYAAFFAKFDCELIDFMALQDWSGGARVVGRRSARADRYYPWLLTRPGSVFIVRGLEPETLADWQRMGLPLPEVRNWTNCPFVRENGYGEIRAERHV